MRRYSQEHVADRKDDITFWAYDTKMTWLRVRLLSRDCTWLFPKHTLQVLASAIHMLQSHSEYRPEHNGTSTLHAHHVAASGLTDMRWCIPIAGQIWRSCRIVCLTSTLQHLSILFVLWQSSFAVSIRYLFVQNYRAKPSFISLLCLLNFSVWALLPNPAFGWWNWTMRTTMKEHPYDGSNITFVGFSFQCRYYRDAIVEFCTARLPLAISPVFSYC